MGGWNEKREQKKDGCVLCSLVDGVEGTVPGKTIGHFVEVPDFGRIFLAEITSLSPFRSTHHGSGRTRLQRARPGQRVLQVTSTEAPSLLRSGWTAGRSNPFRLPAQHLPFTRGHIREDSKAEFLRGNLGVWRSGMRNKLVKNSPGVNRSWDIKFRLLEAEILTYQGDSQRVVQLLQRLSSNLLCIRRSRDQTAITSKPGAHPSQSSHAIQSRVTNGATTLQRKRLCVARRGTPNGGTD